MYSALTLKRPLLDASAVWRPTPTNVVLAGVGLGLFRPVSRLAAVSLQVAIHLVLDVLGSFSATIAARFAEALGLDGYASRERRPVSENLMKMALSGCAPALEVYNELERRDRDRMEVAHHCLAFLVMLAASACIGAHSVAALGWTTLASTIRPVPAGTTAVVGTWMLLSAGLSAPSGSTLEYDTSNALPKRPKSDAAPAARVHRAGRAGD